MVDYYWTGEASNSWNDPGNWRDNANQVMTTVPTAADTAHFGEYLLGGVAQGFSCVVPPGTTNIETIYTYGTGGGSTNGMLGPLSDLMNFTITILGTLNCEDAFFLAGQEATPTMGGGGGLTSTILNGGGALIATNMVHICGGEYDLLTVWAPNLSIKLPFLGGGGGGVPEDPGEDPEEDPFIPPEDPEDPFGGGDPPKAGGGFGGGGFVGGTPPQLNATTWVVGPGVFCCNTTVEFNSIIFQGATTLDQTGLAHGATSETVYGFPSITVGILSIQANLTANGNRENPLMLNMVSVMNTLDIGAAVTVNDMRVQLFGSCTQAHSLVFTQNAYDCYGALAVNTGAMVLIGTGGFTGYGDLSFFHGSSLTFNTGYPIQCGSLHGNANTAVVQCGDIYSNGGQDGVFQFLPADGAGVSTVDIFIDTSLASHTPVSVVGFFGTSVLNNMTLNSFRVVSSTTFVCTQNSEAKDVVMLSGFLAHNVPGPEVTTRSIIFGANASGWGIILNLKPDITTTTPYDASLAGTFSSGIFSGSTINFYPNNSVTNSIINYTINGGSNSYNSNPIPNFNWFQPAACTNTYNSMCVSTNFSNFQTTVQTSTSPTNVNFTFFSLCWMQNLTITGGSSMTSLNHTRFNFTAIANGRLTFLDNAIIASHSSCSIRQEHNGVLWARNSNDTDWGRWELNSGSSANGTHNAVVIASNQLGFQALTGTQFYLGAECELDISTAAGGVKMSLAHDQTTQPVPHTVADYHFFSEDTATILLNPTALFREDFYIEDTASTMFFGVQYGTSISVAPSLSTTTGACYQVDSNSNMTFLGAILLSAHGLYHLLPTTLHCIHKSYTGDTRDSLQLQGKTYQSHSISVYCGVGTGTRTAFGVLINPLSAVPTCSSVYLNGALGMTVTTSLNSNADMDAFVASGQPDYVFENNSSGAGAGPKYLTCYTTCQIYPNNSVTWDYTFMIALVNDATFTAHNATTWGPASGLSSVNGDIHVLLANATNSRVYFDLALARTQNCCMNLTISSGCTGYGSSLGGGAVHHINGLGTYNWRGSIASPAENVLTFLPLGGPIDVSTLTYSNEDQNCKLRIEPHITPANLVTFGKGTYNALVQTGYDTTQGSAGITGHFTISATTPLEFNGGLELNYDVATQFLPNQFNYGAINSTSTILIDGASLKVNGWTFLHANAIEVRNVSGVIGKTYDLVTGGGAQLYNAVEATTAIAVNPITTDCIFTGAGIWKTPVMEVYSNTNTRQAMLTNLEIHDGSQGHLHLGITSMNTQKDVTVGWINAYVNYITMGPNSAITPVSGQTYPNTHFVGTLNRDHIVTDNNAITKTLVGYGTNSVGSAHEYTGTPSLGIVEVQSGRNLTFASASGNGAIFNSLTAKDGVTITVNTAMSITALGDASNCIVLEGSSQWLSPGNSASHRIPFQYYKTLGTTCFNLTGNGVVELGGTAFDFQNIMFEGTASATSAISLTTGQTLKIRNSTLYSHAFTDTTKIINAATGTPTVEINDSMALLNNQLAYITGNTVGHINGCKLTATNGQRLLTLDTGGTLVVSGLTFSMNKNTFKGTALSDCLVEFAGIWYANLYRNNTFSSVGPALKYSALGVSNNQNPLRDLTFNLPTNVSPVVSTNSDVIGTNCYISTANSEVGGTAHAHIFAHTNGTNRSTTMLGGTLSGEQNLEIMRWYSKWNGTQSTQQLLTIGEKTYLVDRDFASASTCITEEIPYDSTQEYKIEWEDLDANHACTATLYRHYIGSGSNSETISSGHIISASGQNTNTYTSMELRIRLTDRLSGFTNVKITNTTTNMVVWSEHFVYKPAFVDNAKSLRMVQFRLAGESPADATTIFPSKPIGVHTVNLKPRKPHYSFGLKRSELLNQSQYHIKFGYQDEDNYYIARFHVLNAFGDVKCQLWKKLNGAESQVGTDITYQVNLGITNVLDSEIGLIWTPGVSATYVIDGSPKPSIAITDFSDGAVGFDTRNQSRVTNVAVHETEGFTTRNTNLIFSSGTVYGTITNGIDLFNCVVNMNQFAVFPEIAHDEDNMVFEQTTFADGIMSNIINGFVELRNSKFSINGDIVLGENGKLHLIGCVVSRPDAARWLIDTRGVAYSDQPPVKIQSCQLRGIYTTIMKDGVLIRLDDAADNSYLNRIYARKEMRISRNRVLGLDFSRSITNGFQSNEQDCELTVVDNMIIPGTLDSYWRGQEIFEFISPYCYEWKGKIVAYRTSILEGANVATLVRFTVEEWRDD